MTLPPDVPILSVCIFTYQHVDFVQECLDSVLSQKTNFTFEILLADDDSTDGTRQICLEYAKKHPRLIRLFLRKEADKIIIDGKKTGRFNIIETFKEAKGKYLIWLDGDDYFCHEEKLQKQVDFLEANPDHAICIHRILERHEKSKLKKVYTSKKWDVSRSFTALELARGDFFICTSACMFRNYLQKGVPDWFWELPYLDNALHVWNAQFGSIGYLPDVMAVYRVHNNGMWSMKGWTFQHVQRAKLFNKMIPHFEGDIQASLLQHQQTLYAKLLPRLLQEGNEEDFISLFNSGKDYPDDFQLKWLMNSMKKMNHQIGQAPDFRLKTFLRNIKKKVRQ